VREWSWAVERKICDGEETSRELITALQREVSRFGIAGMNECSEYYFFWQQ